MVFRRIHLLAVAVVVAPMLVNACGSSSGSNSTGTGGAAGHPGGSGGHGGTGGVTAGTGGGAAGTAGGAGGSAGAGATAVDAATGCGYVGGDVTAALFPNGLTLTTACSPYHVSGNNLNVGDGGTLTIQAGVTLRFEINIALTVGLSGTGKLLANGTAQAPILLAPDTTPNAAGDWYGLELASGTATGTKVSYTRIDFAGGNFDGVIVGQAGLPAGAVTLDHVTIDHVGDGSHGILEQDPNSSLVITNSTFNGIPMGSFAIDLDAASFAGIGAGNTFASGTAIGVEGGTVSTTTAWANPGVPVVVNQDLAIDGASAPTLTVAAGTTLEFADGVAMTVGQTAGGKLVAAGTAAAHVTLTSSAMMPMAGEWAGVKVYALGKAQLSYTDFRYGGSGMDDSKGNLSLESVASTVQLMVDHGTFRNSLGWGIYVACAAAGQMGATITVDTLTTYMTNTLGTRGPGPTGPGCP